MRKTYLLLFALLISSSIFAQQRTRSFMGWHLAKDAPTKLNELKLNLGTTIFGLFPEISYERIISEDFSLGASAGISLGEEYTLDYALTPYARWFFGGSSTNLQKYGAGFFIELNGSLFSRDHLDIIYEHSSSSTFSSNKTGAGLGLALGWKYLSKNNWIGEFYMGGGRDFTNDSGYPRVGLTIGKRF